MLKRIWYQLFKIFIGTGLFFFFKKIKVNDTHNIPKKGAILFVSNHKNAMIDPLIIATTTKRNVHFLTRASAFKIKVVHWFLSTLNLIPIYRVRDGKETLAKNEMIFNICFDILNNQETLLIFPEGTHNIKRWVEPLKKGFTRIAFGTLEKYPNLELHILPIGLNYSDATSFGESVSIYYGKPILANDYYNATDINASTQNLKDIIHKKLTELTTHIESDSYETIIEELGDVDYLAPNKVTNALENLANNTHEKIPISKPSILWKSLKYIVAINSFIPMLLYKSFVPKIKEIEFVSTTKFGIGLTAFPLFYTLQSLVIHHFFGFNYALIYLLTSILFVLLLVKSKG